jgi:hypothetical protein
MAPAANGTSSTFTSLPIALSKSLSSLPSLLDTDPQWQAYINTAAIVEPVTIGVASTGSDAILVTVSPRGQSSVETGDRGKADFVLSAKGEQWEKFFEREPRAPFTSFVGLQVRCSPIIPRVIVSVSFSVVELWRGKWLIWPFPVAFRNYSSHPSPSRNSDTNTNRA